VRPGLRSALRSPIMPAPSRRDEGRTDGPGTGACP
jgi:hypothetical protein